MSALLWTAVAVTVVEPATRGVMSPVELTVALVGSELTYVSDTPWLAGVVVHAS